MIILGLIFSLDQSHGLKCKWVWPESATVIDHKPRYSHYATMRKQNKNPDKHRYTHNTIIHIK